MTNTRLHRKSFIWNMIASFTYGCFSFLTTLFVIRICGSETGGLYSICFAMSQTVQVIGFFGVGSYQITDLKQEFDFSEYLSSRVLTVLLMMATGFANAVIFKYDGEKALLFTLLLTIKVCEVTAEVFESMIHQRNRLDISAKCLFFRTFLTILAFIATLSLTGDVIKGAAVTAMVSVLVVAFISVPEAIRFDKIVVLLSVEKYRRVFGLLKCCLPLFMISIINIVSLNLTKIVIDCYLDYTMQAYYSVIFMPAMFTNMVTGFLFKPVLNSLTTHFNNNDYERLKKIITVISLLVFFVLLLMLIGVWFLGVPVLNIVYDIDITQYKLELMIITLSSGCYAYINLFTFILIAMRQQKKIFSFVAISFIMTMPFAWMMVRNLGMKGAALHYMLSMFLCAAFLGALIISSMRRIRSLERLDNNPCI